MNHYVLTEVAELDGCTFTDHVVTKALSIEAAMEKWCNQYKNYKEIGECNYDVGTFTLECTGVKEIEESEYKILTKYFKEI